MSYATAYEIGLGKKPVNSNLLRQNFPNVIQEQSPQSYSYDKYYESSTQSAPIPSTQSAPSQPQQERNIPRGSSNPLVWGPLFWYTLHNSAIHYPVNASPLVKQRILNRIQAIPYEVPCKACQIHASAYIESLSDYDLDKIVSGRDNLFKFYVDFHNSVNTRLGKPVWSYQQALNYYSDK
jgi:hypothetical protein